MGQEERKKSLLELFHEMEVDKDAAPDKKNGISIPEGRKEVSFEMEVGIHRYKVKVWRDGFRGIDVFESNDGNPKKLYALTFSENGDGRFSDGWQMKGMQPYIISRDNFGSFAQRYGDHIQWLARNLDKDMCEEFLELFTLGY